jgi:hypothetical protein
MRSWLRRVWSSVFLAFAALSRRPALATAIVFVVAFGSPVALQHYPDAWKPYVHDEFSYLLGAETFLHGRLTNPPHPMARHFDTFHVLQRPTYASKFPPANALFIAAGWKLGGKPAIGVLLSYAFMCACIAWMLQAYIGRLLGFSLALVFALRLADSDWAISFWGGAVAAGAGAMVLGAAARLWGARSIEGAKGLTRNAVVLAVGLLLLANSRPYEGLCFAAPVVLVLAVQSWRRHRASLGAALRRVVAPFVVIMALGAAAMMVYNDAVTGSWREMPYTAYTRIKDSTPIFAIETPRAVGTPADSNAGKAVAKTFYANRRVWTPRGAAIYGYFIATFVLFIVPAAALLPFALAPLTARDRHTRLALLSLVGIGLGMTLTTWHLFHYAAPATAAVLAVYGACLHLLGMLRLGRRRVGRALAAALLLVFALTVPWNMAMDSAKGKREPGWPAHRLTIADSLGRKGPSVVFVRYARTHPTTDEWVYNSADIDASPVVWAHDQGPEANAELLRYYRNRTAWIVDVDQDTGPFPVQPYGVPSASSGGPTGTGHT